MAVLIEKCVDCGSEELRLNYRADGKTALMCCRCDKWLKWVATKEIPAYERIARKNILNNNASNNNVSNNNVSNNSVLPANIEIKILNKDTGIAQYKILTNEEVEKLFDALDINKCLL